MSATRDPNTDQPLPVKGLDVVPDLAVANWVAAMNHQTELGQAKYGQKLHTYDGRDSVQELRGEVPDVLIYLEKLIQEYKDALIGTHVASSLLIMVHKELLAFPEVAFSPRLFAIRDVVNEYLDWIEQHTPVLPAEVGNDPARYGELTGSLVGLGKWLIGSIDEGAAEVEPEESVNGRES